MLTSNFDRIPPGAPVPGTHLPDSEALHPTAMAFRPPRLRRTADSQRTMAENRLNLGEQLPVVLQRSGNTESRFMGTLLGKVGGNRLLIACNEDPGFAAAERVIVRAIQEGRVLGFETSVREALSEPVPLVFLDVPANVEIKSLRKSDRLNVFLPADVSTKPTKGGVEGDMLMFRGTILNISGGGCQLFANRKVGAEQSVRLAFNLPGEKRDTTISGAVLDCYQQGALYGHRVRFHHVDSHLQDLNDIRRWVNQHQVYADL